jgi:hypothetical protein
VVLRRRSFPLFEAPEPWPAGPAGDRSAPLSSDQGARIRATPAAPPPEADQSGAEMTRKIGGGGRLAAHAAEQLLEFVVVLGLQTDFAVRLGVPERLHGFDIGLAEPAPDRHAVAWNEEPVDVVSCLD